MNILNDIKLEKMVDKIKIRIKNKIKIELA